MSRTRLSFIVAASWPMAVPVLSVIRLTSGAQLQWFVWPIGAGVLAAAVWAIK